MYAILSVGSTGVTSSEAARVHIAAGRRGGNRVADCGTRAAAGDAGRRLVSAGSSDAPLAAAFRKGLNDAGYVEGQNVMVEYHWLSLMDTLRRSVDAGRRSRARGKSERRAAAHHRTPKKAGRSSVRNCLVCKTIFLGGPSFVVFQH